MAHWEPGSKVQYEGKMWTVKSLRRDYPDGNVMVELIRERRDPLVEALRFGSGSPYAFQPIQEKLEIDARLLLQQEARDIMGRFTGLQSYGSDPTGIERKKVEAELRANLEKMGIKVGGSDALSDMVRHVSEQMAAMTTGWQAISNAARPASQALGQLRKSIESMSEQERKELEDVELSRKAELDARFTEPEADGVVVFWHKGELRNTAAGVKFTFERFSFGDHDDDYDRQCERVESVEAAWQFVDYLNDDEAGTPMAIRDGAVVLFYHSDAGWEALCELKVPRGYDA